jgi:hypothetical protein
VESSNRLDSSQALCWTTQSSNPLASGIMVKRKEAPRITERHLRRQARLRALVDREKTQKGFAIKHGLNEKHVSQMLREPGKRDWRGVGDETVEKLEADPTLKLQKGYFDAPEVSEPLSAAQAESRPKNSVLALRVAIQSLFAVLHEQQQDTAEGVARDILQTAGTQFVTENLFLKLLVCTLQGVREMSEDDLKKLLQAPVSRGSKRAISAAK